MIIKTKGRVTILGKENIQGRKDPSKTYYKVGVNQDSEYGSIYCNKELYDQVELNKQYDISISINTIKNSFYLQSAEPCLK